MAAAPSNMEGLCRPGSTPSFVSKATDSTRTSANKDRPTNSSKKLLWDYGVMSPSSGSAPDSANGSGLNLSEKGKVAVAQPELIQQYLYPISADLSKKIISTREYLTEMLHNDLVQDRLSPLLVLTGPAYITDAAQAKACSNWLNLISVDNTSTNNISYESIRRKNLPKCIEDIYTESEAMGKKLTRDHILIAMRANLVKLNIDYEWLEEKQREKQEAAETKAEAEAAAGAMQVEKKAKDTFEDRPIVKSFEIQNGIPICRSLLCELAEKVPLAGQLSDTLTPQYLSDLFCLSLVSSPLIESQLHRELVSGASYPVGYHTHDAGMQLKSFDDYEYKLKVAKEAILASKNPHHFLSVTKLGQVAIIGTTGNDDTFIVLQLSNDTGPLQLSFEQVEKVFEVLKSETAKVLIDIGLISAKNIRGKIDFLQKLLIEDLVISRKVVGVMINSGELYIPEKTGDPASAGPASATKDNNNTSAVYGSGKPMFNFSQSVSFEDLKAQLSSEELQLENLEEQIKTCTLSGTSTEAEYEDAESPKISEDEGNANSKKRRPSLLSRVGKATQKAFDISKLKFSLGSATGARENQAEIGPATDKAYESTFENLIYANKMIFAMNELAAKRNELIKTALCV